MRWWGGTEEKENWKLILFCSTNLNHCCWPQVTSPQYKTVLCQQFMEGKGCQFGESCSFAHGHAEIRNVQMNLAALNPNYKGTLCKYFMTTGECEFGSICQYAHGNMVGRRLRFPLLIFTLPRRSWEGTRRWAGWEVVGTNILITWEVVETRTLVTWEEEALRPLSGRLHCAKITRRMEGLWNWIMRR